MKIERQDAIVLLQEYVKNRNMLNHCYASEAVMRALASRLCRNGDDWAMAGLLHDLDVEVTLGDMNIHGLETARILREKGFAEDIIDAIAMHNETSAGKKRFNEFQFALAAGETITGMIVATTLVYPDRKLSSVKAESVIKRMKEKKFAASVRRENIIECENIGIPLEEFVEICLEAMGKISHEIGL